MDFSGVRRICLLGLVLAFASLCWLSAASADMIHEAVYYWYDTGGSRWEQTRPEPATVVVGDVSGQQLLKVQEDVYTPDQNEGGPCGSWLFTYHVDAFQPGPPGSEDADPMYPGNQWVTSFGVPKGASVLAAQASVVPGSGGAVAWDFVATGSHYGWAAPPGSGIDGLSSGVFQLWVMMPPTLQPVWTISSGGVADFDTECGPHTGWISGWVSHPNVPEPGTLALLSVGMLGFLPALRRRRST